MKKILSTLIAVSMLASISAASAATAYNDTKGHWAENQINNWSNYGVISGYDGQFSPNRSITRGEFAVVLNRLMNYQDTQENAFSDLDNNFYTDSVLKLNKAGVMQGYEDSISPNANLTRQEAASLICRALGIAGQEKAEKTFLDSDDVSSWASASMNAMINLGLINGADGKLNPQHTITRAEVVTILDNAVLPVLTPGEVTNIETNKILVISANNVIIKDSKINGKVVVTQGVTEGNVAFVNTEIEEDITIDNSRKDIVVLENTTVNGEKIEEGIYEPVEKEPSKEEDNASDDKPSQGGSNSGSNGGSNGGSGSGSGSGNSGGGNKDDSSDDNTGDDNTGDDNTGDDNTGDDNTGDDNTGDDNTGDDNTGGDNTGDDNTGDDNTGDDNTGGDNTGDDNTGDDNTGDDNTGDNEPEEEHDAAYYIAQNAEMVRNISAASADIAPYLALQNLTFTPQEKYLLTIIKNAMDETIPFQDKKIIDKSFLKVEFPDQIAEAKRVYDEMDDAGLSSAFTEKLIVNLNSATIEWLADAFGLLD